MLDCRIEINQTLLFFKTGNFPTSKTFFYDKIEQRVLPGPSLRAARKRSSCALLNYKDQLLVIVAGGEGPEGPKADSELLNLDPVIASTDGESKWMPG